MTAPYLGMHGLGVSFPRTESVFRRRRFFAVRHVTLDIHKNETFCLIGESGSGKSTLINALLGFHPFQEGEIEFNGRAIKKRNDPVHRNLGKKAQMVFQDPFASLNPFLTLKASVEEPLKARGIGKKERADIVGKLADRTGLSDQTLRLTPSKVSGGQNQRACIARALSTNPEILFLDEPLSALDMAMKKQVAGLLRRIKEKYEITFFLITHDLGLVKKMGTTVAVMYLGRIVERAPKKRFFDNPRHPYSQALLSSALEPGIWHGKRIILKGEIPSAQSPPAGCVFHPRCFRRLDKCEKIPPPSGLVDAGHEVRCHLY